uniref:Replication-associated protein n=1 Tax=Psittacidae CRESS-DNA-virus sp. TaxID=2815057 RepID=A0A8A4XBC9_9VIRU|nr:MAG: replication-associated protein [Psittacidae CRESS-DNA-virus sp.]
MARGGQYYPPLALTSHVSRLCSMPRTPQSSLALSWTFTLNNYSDDEVTKFTSWLSVECSYAIFGKEVGANGTPHLQGYFKLLRQRRLSALKSNLDSRAHYEVAKGSAWSNKIYCSKDGNVWEWGQCPGKPPKRSRDELASTFKLASEAGRDALVTWMDDNPGVNYFSGHTLVRNHLRSAQPVERPDISVEWIWGEPGVGKSRLAHERFPAGFVKEPRTKWWTGYNLERDVIIDDFGPKGIDINHLLRWFDRYRCTVETKGDIVPLHAVNFVVTSNFSPEQCFVGDDGGPHPQIPALRRRMTVTHMLSFP